MTDIREHVLWLLRGGHAHIGFDQVVADLPPELQGAQPPGTPHTPWRLLEHMRIAQWDILEFSRNPAHESPDFPDGYWPEHDAPPDADAWERTIAAFHNDADQLQALVADPSLDLLAPFPWGEGQTLLREALLVADHNAYHLGQMIVVRQALGAW
ncbi:DinB superfamily protein [Posidoniimonas corsicana]|uniref:DinB superfamily protein n=1 Tax=Posidoniimonas corsicana TaxID=1938618 RepID=A0A5C5VH05_9BACT|nr:DinB family protein [Posidoniimonas corsicana]TWT37230.1 DinB superfamily protein [Posidoniimonas corsicana]